MELKSVRPRYIRIWTVFEPKNAVKHRFASYYDRSSVQVSSVQRKLPTSENFHIRCKGTTNEEAEGEKLLCDEVGLDILQHLTYLGPEEHWQATVATHEHYCEETAPSYPIRPSDRRIIT